jgi:uncharacterized RDD family membrane protein YckC
LNELIRCPNCDASILPAETHCPHCGAKQLPRRVMFGQRREEFTLTSEENRSDVGEPAEWEQPQFAHAPTATPSHPSIEAQTNLTPEIRWGGFFRRAFAFLVDVVMVFLLSAMMGLLAYVGYKVGLSAHGRSITWQRATPLFAFLTWGWIFLITGYFVLFHGMEGKTIGKWLLGLRVVGLDRRMITYRQAFLRSLATLVAFAPFGLGVLWILWSPEKRGWHDFLARTWVVRD